MLFSVISVVTEQSGEIQHTYEAQRTGKGIEIFG